MRKSVLLAFIFAFSVAYADDAQKSAILDCKWLANLYGLVAEGQRKGFNKSTIIENLSKNQPSAATKDLFIDIVDQVFSIRKEHPEATPEFLHDFALSYCEKQNLKVNH